MRQRKVKLGKKRQATVTIGGKDYIFSSPKIKWWVYMEENEEDGSFKKTANFMYAALKSPEISKDEFMETFDFEELDEILGTLYPEMIQKTDEKN